MGKFPDFIIIGAMKCGTTVLRHNLDRHPEITMGRNRDDPKATSTEIRFWNDGLPYRNWKRGFDWYKENFEGKISGEKCANYLESKKAMRRISKHLPDVKLIACVRNPADRAYSQYRMSILGAGAGKYRSFEHALRKNKAFFRNGLYYRQMRDHVLPYFSRERLFVAIQERMKADTPGEMAKIFQFLGAGACDLEVEEVPFSERDGSVEGFRKWQSGYGPMEDETRRTLVEKYRGENERLFEFLGHSVDEWER